MAALVRAAGQTPMLPGAVVVQGLVYTSGIADPAVLGGGAPSFPEQAAAALAALLETLAACGTDAAHVVKLEAFLADPADFAAWNAAFLAVWPEPGPARTTLVTGFVLETMRFEVQAVAAVP